MLKNIITKTISYTIVGFVVTTSMKLTAETLNWAMNSIDRKTNSTN